jgi:hypothetical protein
MGSIVTLMVLLLIFVFIEWMGREQQYALAHIVANWSHPSKFALYYVLIFAIFLFGGKEQQFIYFQF